MPINKVKRLGVELGLVEQKTLNLLVVGSNPTAPTKNDHTALAQRLVATSS